MLVKFKKLRDGAVLPESKSDLAAGLDLFIPSGTQVRFMDPGETRNVPLGFAVEIPPGFVGLMSPRSEWFKKGWHVKGCVSPEYRGEVYLMIQAPIKTSPIPALKPGDCPAQMIITRVEHVTTEWVEGLSET